MLKKTRNVRRLTYPLLGLTALIVVFSILNTQHWFHTFIEQRISTLFGREFKINGNIHADWDWTSPGLSIEGIQIANLPDGKQPSMVKIKKLDFHIRIWRLFLFETNFPNITITSPEIILEKFSTNRKNWDFPALSTANMAKQAAVPDDRTEFPIVDVLKITDGVLIYRDHTKQLSTNLKFESVKGDVPKEGMFVIKGEGALQDRVFKLYAAGGSLNMLRNAAKPYPLKMDIHMGLTHVAVDGQFDDPIKMQGINAKLDITGSSLADLFYLTHIPLPPSAPYQLKGNLTQDNKIWHFNGFNGRLGDSDLAGDLSYDVKNERGYIEANLASKLLNFDDLSGLIGATPNTVTLSPEQEKQLKAQQASPHFLPDIPIDLTRLRAADMKVRLKALHIKAPDLPLDDLDIGFNLHEGVLELKPLQFGVAGGDIKGNLVLDGRHELPAVNADMAVKRVNLKQFFSQDSSLKSLSSGYFGGVIQLTGNGKSVADVLAGSNGKVTLVMNGGKIDLLLVEAMGLDLGDAIPLLLGDDKSTDIRCMVGDFKIQNGLLNSDILVLDTTDSNINGDLKINLKNEMLNGKIETHPKDFSILSARTPILLDGTLKQPSISLDKEELLIKGVAAVALGALLTPAGALLPTIEWGLGEDSDCAKLTRQAQKK